MSISLSEFGLLVHYVTPPYIFWIIACVCIGVLIYADKMYKAALFSIALCATIFTVVVLKMVFAIPRPPQALVELTSYSFPSAHAAASMFLATMGTWLFSFQKAKEKRWHVYAGGIFLFLVASLIGISRIVIGVHTPMQVLAGFAVGVLVPLLVLWIAQKVNNYAGSSGK